MFLRTAKIDLIYFRIIDYFLLFVIRFSALSVTARFKAILYGMAFLYLSRLRFAKRPQLCQVQATTVHQNNTSNEFLTFVRKCVRSPPFEKELAVTYDIVQLYGSIGEK
ncbi:hypothetical protein D5F53_30425 [Paenibacillus lautus]|uniref:Uncharacterized protein n=1 Tax=Paenibacillus lautus TaxID=1401 RepID=A0A385TWS8_PAELA|nr:hypothetical protein D5F53_30425 [Paenibacillus lautus]